MAASSNFPKPKNGHLTLWICIAIVAAIIISLFLPRFAMKLHLGGEIFLRLLKMIVVPLVITSVLNGILGLGDVRKLGKPGLAAITYYLCTTLVAVSIGLIVVNAIQPGVGTVDEAKLAEFKGVGLDSPKQKMLRSLSELTGMTTSEVGSVFGELPSGENEAPSVATIIENLALMVFTDNLFKSAANTDLLPLIVFSIIFGAMLTTLGSRVKTITQLIEQTNTALMNFVLLLMKIAPLGIFCLVAARFGEAVD
jgi:Na+/H+-dicarboxylate symporter